jgi:hypothetical protein
MVRHLADLGNVDAAVRILWKAHQAEAEPERIHLAQVSHLFFSFSFIF